jgi:hypothetical protein
MRPNILANTDHISEKLTVKTANFSGPTPSGIGPAGQIALLRPTACATMAAVAGASPVTIRKIAKAILYPLERAPAHARHRFKPKRRFGMPRRSFRAAASFVYLYLGLVIQDRIQERTMNLDLAIIGDKAELAKLVHEKADTGAGRPDHLCQRLLADLRRDGLRGAILSEICHKQEKTREPLLAGIE